MKSSTAALLALLVVGLANRAEAKRVARVFDVVWKGTEPLALGTLEETNGAVILTLRNVSGQAVAGFVVGIAPPGEGGCKANDHPFGNDVPSGVYTNHDRPTAVRLGLPPGAPTTVRLEAAELRAWSRKRTKLRCDPGTPSQIFLERVCLDDGREWTPAGWNRVRTQACQALERRPHPDGPPTPTPPAAGPAWGAPGPT